MTNTVSRLISDEVLDAGIQIESGGNPRADAATSSALGLAQFLNATWMAVVKVHRPDLLKSRTQAQVLALRLDPTMSIEMMARFWEDNLSIIGHNATPGDLYLAHFLGAGTAKAVFRASPNIDIAQVVSSAAIRANRSIFTKYNTPAKLRAWAASKMKSHGGHNWVKKYYKSVLLDDGTEFSSQNKKPLAKNGDPDLLADQQVLAGMHYYTGELDGLWGGKTSGAIAGFINDRGGFIAAPASYAQYRTVRDRIKVELDKAEIDHFTRPVTKEREELHEEVVARIAPEAVPAKTGFLASLWGGIATFFLAVFNTVSSYIGQAWDFFTDNKDSLPTDPNFVMNIIHKVPASVWIFLVAIVFGFIAWSAHKSLTKIREGVRTGER